MFTYVKWKYNAINNFVLNISYHNIIKKKQKNNSLVVIFISFLSLQNMGGHSSPK